MKNFTISSPKFNPVTVDFDALPEVSKDYIIQRGFDHLNDVHAGIHVNAKDKEGTLLFGSQEDVNLAALKAITEKVSALMNGVVSVRRASAEPIDPVAKRVLENVRVIIDNAIKKNGKSKKDFTKESYAKAVKDYTDTHIDSLTKTAKAELKRESEIGGEVDLSSLGL